MTVVTENLLEEMTRLIVGEIDPEAIYLFGSHARAEADESFDLDLLIVEKEPFGPTRDHLSELERIRRLLTRFDVPKDILVFSLDEFTYWSDSLNHIVGRCLREGGRLYVRPQAGS